MVDKVKQASKTTSKALQNAYEVGSMAASVAAAVKVASLPKVETSFGALPIWQLVAGVVIAGVVVRVYTLLNK